MSVRCVAGQTYTFGIALESVANAGKFQVAPTLDALDFRISTNGGAFAALTNTPTVTPASGMRVQVVLAAAETTAAGAGGEIYLKCSDNSGGEWKDLVVAVPVYANAEDTLVATATNVTTVNGLAANVITATAIASDAITAAKIADGAIDAATFAAGAINAPAIATDAIGAAEIAADAVAKIQDGLATPTNITAGTIATVTNVTNGVTLASGAITAAVIATDAIDADAIAASAVTEIQNGLATLAGLFGYDLNGKTFEQAVIEIWATRVGGATRNSTSYPFTADYDGPDGTVEVSHVHASALSRTLD